jgi:hypothetical protein
VPTKNINNKIPKYTNNKVQYLASHHQAQHAPRQKKKEMQFQTLFLSVLALGASVVMAAPVPEAQVLGELVCRCTNSLTCCQIGGVQVFCYKSDC